MIRTDTPATINPKSKPPKADSQYQQSDFGKRHTEEAFSELVTFIAGFPVTQFVTLTFGRPTSERVALQKIREWHDSLEWLNRAAIGILICLEDKPELHAHCILVGAPNLNLTGAAALWRQSAGDADVRRYDSSRGGIAYSLKDAFWTGQWSLDHFDFYSRYGRKRRAQLTREQFYRALGIPVPQPNPYPKVTTMVR